MVFTKDSTFKFGKGRKRTSYYGITHTLPYKLVEEEDEKIY